MSEERMSIKERLVASAGVSALRSALMSMNLGLSESQCILVDEVVSPLIREAVVAEMRRQNGPVAA